jgi:hypothetical protein
MPALPAWHPIFAFKITDMKKRILLLLLAQWACTLLVAQMPERHVRAEVSLVGKTIAELAALGIEVEHGAHHAGQSLTLDLSSSELEAVQNAGFQANVLVPDLLADYLQRLEEDQRQGMGSHPRGLGCADGALAYATPQNYSYGSMGGYHTLAELLVVLDDMAAKFPDLVKPRAALHETLLTHEGRPIWYVKISDNPNADEQEPKILYTALHHAREPNSLSQMLFFMWHLLENYETDPEVRYILQNSALYFVPCLNPDGYVFNEFLAPQGGGMWRKNRRDNGDGTVGVDLNRNYGHFWGNDNFGSSPSPNSGTYRGPAAFSEPETEMLRQFVESHDFVFALNYHTSGNLFIHPWGYNDVLADPLFGPFSDLCTRENGYKAGTAIQTVGYFVNGTSDDWMFANGVIACTPEVGLTGFWPMPSEIDALNKQNLWQNMATALSALRFGLAEPTDGDHVAALNFQMPLRFTRYGYEPGPFQLRLSPVSANIAGGSQFVQFDPPHLQPALHTFDITLQPNVAPGETLVWTLAVDNGVYERVDTIRRVYIGSSPTALAVQDDGSSLDGWVGDWGLNFSNFNSAPSSITDSPDGTYLPQSSSYLLSAEPINIPANALKPQLRFAALWNIQSGFDYAQVRGFGSNGNDLPLCGLHTRPGRNSQPVGEPVYDGVQLDWVAECMDLSDFKGQALTLAFLMVANDFIEADGFYFDDLQVEYVDLVSGSTVVKPLRGFRLLQNTPNPTTGQTLIGWEADAAQRVGEKANLLIVNTLGETVLSRPIALRQQNQVGLDLEGLPAGLYTYFLEMPDGQRSEALRLLVCGAR